MMIEEELASNIIETGFERFDDNTVKEAKQRIIDIVGCTIGGASGSGCSELRSLVREWGGREEATILIHGEKAPLQDAAMINSIMARSYDFGVFTPYIGDKVVWAHNAETSVPTAITVAEFQRAGGKELLTALILGDDLTTRIAAASTQAISRGWDTPGTVNKFGATAIAGKLLGLSERQIIEAWGIVLNQLAGSFQTMQDGTHSFKLAQGLAAHDGVVAAELAGKGWTGAREPLLGKYGYFALYCQEHDPEFLTRDLGKQFYGDKIFKPYPSCRFIHSAIDCALKLVKGHDISAEDIADITLDTAPMHYDSPLNQPFEPGEVPQAHALFSLRYNIANVLLRKCVRLEHLTEEMILDTEVGTLARKVNITGNMPPEKIEAADLTVRMKDGQEYHAYEDVSIAHPILKPWSHGDIVEKYWANVAFSNTVSRENAEKLLDILNHLEEVDDITGVIKLLIA
jgi:2-methylcitrate dehydratase PrpD